MSAKKMIFEKLPSVQQKLKNPDKTLLENLHLVLYGEYPKSKISKRRILSFSGYGFLEKSEDFKKHLELISKSISILGLQELCTFFDQTFANSATAFDLAGILLNVVFKIMKENGVMDDDEVKSVISLTKSKNSFRSIKSHQKRKQDVLLEIQNDINRIEEDIFSKHEEIIILETEIEDMKNIDNAPLAELKLKENELSKKEKLLKLHEARLKSKEKLFSQYEAIFEREESSEGESSQESMSKVSGLEKVEEWSCENTARDETPQNDQMQELTKSINNMLARQTIGNHLNTFDGSSCLQWPIYYSQYKLTNEACLFSPRENVLRLNRSLIGEARATVEMLLITAQNPDEILDILQKKYGRPELIMDELLAKAHQLPPVDSIESFLSFSSTVRNVASVVEGEIAYYVDQRNVLSSFVNKLPSHLLTQWGSYLIEKQIENHKESLRDFSNWVQKMSEAVSRITFVSRSQTQDNGSYSKTQNLQFQSNELKYSPDTKMFTNPLRICTVCNKGEHPLERCQQFQNADVRQRWKLVQKFNNCYHCLRIHKGKCKRRKQCGLNNCDRFHHKLLHKPKDIPVNTLPRGTEVNAYVNENICSTLLKILPVKLMGPNGTFNITALLDEGSTATLLDSEIAAKIGLVGPTSPLCCRWTGEICRYDDNSQIVHAKIAAKNGTVFHELRNIRTLQDLKLPEQHCNIQKIVEQFPFVRQVALDFEIEQKPSLLIGQNNAHLIITRQVIQPHPSTPVLSRTKIGWTIHGSIAPPKKREELSFVCCDKADENLHDLVKNYMKIDSFGISTVQNKHKRSREDERALTIAQNSIEFRGGQYTLKLPWKQDDTELPESKRMAMRRLICLERRLSRDEKLKKAYCNEIDKLLKKNYAVPVEIYQLKNVKRLWFLPHFPVQNPNKPNKVRIVFDAAAKNSGFSLNDFLLTGPDLLASLFGILLQFRIHKIAFVGDIREMFNRVQIAEEDTFAQCFLWRNVDGNISPMIYRMTAMLFGTTSSPFLAQFVKNFNANKHRLSNPEAADAIIENHYVDDFLHGTETEEQAIDLVNEVIKIHSLGGFEIRNFISNSQRVLQGIPKHLISESRRDMELHKNNDQERILGMMWNSQKDSFNFKLKFHKVPKPILNGEQIPTKRQVLKMAMSVYDPLGLLSPITIKIKILLQNIWRAGIGWDDSITENMFSKWLAWLKELKDAIKIEIPRCYSPNLKKADLVELHMFSDSSEHAYSAAVYLRIVCKNNVEVALVTSKTRVSPLKTQTIPKLELQGAVLGVKLTQETANYLKIDMKNTFYWSDSRTVLHWLRTEKKLQTFVAARVGEILEITRPEQWNWVPTSENVADDCTRENSKYKLEIDHRWFRGPEFLYQENNFWPKLNQLMSTDEDEMILSNISSTKEFEIDSVPEIKSYYSWIKLLRITARINQFVSLLKRTRNIQETGSFLTAEDLNWSETLWWKIVQYSCFPVDINNAKKNIPNKNGRLHHTSIFLGSDQILRVSSRITKIGEISGIIEKEPVVLDGNHPYTQKMIMHIHLKNAHQGVEIIINELRRRFWIPHIRSAVKKTIRTCSYCVKRTAKNVQPIMGLLPEERLYKHEKPFSATGIDYFGPFSIKIGRRVEKRYGVLFTCLTVRAIHVEIAHSLSTDSCIMAVRRFLARRGAVKVIWTDNGTNLRGASRELMEALDDLDLNPIMDELTNRGITWKRIPPLSPFMGGSWERLIGCFKRALQAVIKDRHPTEEVLQTLFAEAEYIVNSRPLTHVSDNPQDAVSICPNDILLGKSAEILAPGLFTETDLLLKKQWRVSQYYADIFWKRWLREYLPTLIARNKWNAGDINLKEGEVVVINENNVPRGVWPLGVIERVYKGDDEVVRVADVRTSQGLFKRPVRKLHRLKIRIDQNSVNTGGDNVGNKCSS